jgi:hypothetical protein
MELDEKLTIRDNLNIALTKVEQSQKLIRDLLEEVNAEELSIAENTLKNLVCANDSLKETYKLFSELL